MLSGKAGAYQSGVLRALEQMLYLIFPERQLQIKSFVALTPEQLAVVIAALILAQCYKTFFFRNLPMFAIS
jgi:hypothetical protein